ncbi:MAG: acyltransferase family protein [Alphaproteobacteria bacterium]
MFLNSLNQFRALAIILVVAIHSFGAAGVVLDTPFKNLIGNFIAAGTILFYFISGFLFHHVSYARKASFNFKSFITKKIKFIFIPYVIMSLPIIIWMITTHNDHYEGLFLPAGKGFYNEYIKPYILYMLTGRHLTAYWFVMVSLTISAMSPLWVRFIKAPHLYQSVIIIFLLAVSAFMHRPVGNIFTPQSIIYYIPVYLFGVYCSIYKASIYDKFQNKEWILLSTFTILLIGQTFFIEQQGTSHKAMFMYAGVDIILFQKLIFCVLILVFLHRFEHVQSRIVDIIARTSFAVFFIHPYILVGFRSARDYIDIPFGLTYYPFIFGIIFLTSIMAALLVKKILGQYSDYIIGLIPPNKKT